LSANRVILIDDQHLVRAGLRALIETFDGFGIVAEGCDGDEALKLVTGYPCDLLILDIAMKRLSGLDALSRIKDCCPDLPVIMLSMYGTKEYIFRALQAGAAGYVLKDGAPVELELAMRSVLNGERYLSPRISTELVRSIFDGRNDPFGVAEVLSPRQLQVLRLIALGRATKEIAFELDLSAKTVESHRAQIMARLNIRDIPGLIFYALRNGIISLEHIQ